MVLLWTYAAAALVIVAFGVWYWVSEQAHNESQQQGQSMAPEPQGSPVSR